MLTVYAIKPQCYFALTGKRDRALSDRRRMKIVTWPVLRANNHFLWRKMLLPLLQRERNRSGAALWKDAFLCRC